MSTKLVRAANPEGRPRFGRFLLQVLLLLTVTTALTEVALRTSAGIRGLPSPLQGTGLPLLDIKLELLERVRREGQPLDCVFVGPSVVNHALDPETFAESYRARTGHRLSCFNLGAPGVSVRAAVALTGIVAAKYHPGLLVLGTITNREQGRESLEARIPGDPWFRYQAGDWNLDGWLREHSRTLLYVQRLHTWLVRPDVDAELSRLETKCSSRGFMHMKVQPRPPGPRWSADVARRIRERFDEGQTDATAASALDQLLDLSAAPGVVLVEVPVHPDLFAHLPGGRRRYEAVLARAEEIAGRHRVLFLRGTGQVTIPDDGWVDPYHMAFPGAEAYSRWIGDRIGAAVAEGRLAGPGPEAPGAAR